MKTTSKPDCGCGKQPPPHSREHDCVPCDLDRFCRNNYFTGKLLTARDLTLEQRYMRDKLRLHHRVLHGWGVACGLLVKPHPFCPDRRIVIEPGVAIDACGYEIVVASPVEIELPQPIKKPPPCDPPEICHPLVVCIRYAECEEEFAPAPFDECGCNSAGRTQANRICEGFKVELRFEEPVPLDRCCDDDIDVCARVLGPCAKPSRAECITLAYIEDYRPGETVVEARINNRDYRPVLASTRIIERALACLLDQTPRHHLTRVKDLDWTHGQEYRCHDFLRFFTGEKDGDGAFGVTFDGPVRTDALNRVFQAVVVRHRHSTPSGVLELAPARTWASSDGLRLYLQVDRSWAERELHNAWFDVYLTLRCSLILDGNGRPVDGELFARLVEDDKYLVAPPSGNGMAGGTLESWIVVRP